MQPEALLNVAFDVSAIGFVLWLAHQLTTKTIPDMTNTYTDATQKQRDDFREVLDKQREDFAEFHRRESASHEKRLDAVMDKCIGNKSGD
ncbi:MAG: hypothetical protein KJO95_08170 [Gammaproteobacteria bacterium]|nr:hypothetical protein [Gammaproteobacteria bacterium]